MSFSLSDDSDVRPPTLAGMDMHGLSIVHADLPGSWDDGDSTFILERRDATSWNVLFEGVLLGVLSQVPPLSFGETESWKISDPDHDNLGAGVSWASWEDAVANLVDYRRQR